MNEPSVMRKYLLLLLGFLAVGCVTEVNLKFATTDRKVVIEGLLTDEIFDKKYQAENLRESDGNYVRLTYTNPANLFEPGAVSADSNYYLRDRAEPIRNARIWIDDGMGQIDTLIADSAQNEPFIGYYIPQKLVCKAGRTYHLNVEIGDKRYEATCFMPIVPEIDPVEAVYIKKPVGKLSGYFPAVFFKKPESKDVFWISKVCAVPTFTDAEVPPFPHFNAQIGNVWNYDVVNGANLPAYVSGLTIQLGTTSSPYFTEWLAAGGTYDVCLFSITKEAYQYYNALIQHLKGDGGAYSPAPASAPTNITGGAIGFFNASSASIKRFRVPD